MPKDVAREWSVVRIRLRGYRRPVHVLREVGSIIGDGDWSGAERLLTRDGRVLAAYRRSRLCKELGPGHRLCDAPVLVLDLRRCRRELAQPEASWSSPSRGAMTELDNLLWDAAASLSDATAGAAVRDLDGFHAQYSYLWGDRTEPLMITARVQHWDERVAWLLAHLVVVDQFDHRHLRSR